MPSYVAGFDFVSAEQAVHSVVICCQGETQIARPGDWIVRDLYGEDRVVPDATFKQHYQGKVD
jgi:hypothetical protein